MPQTSIPSHCFCGAKKSYPDCCQALVEGARQAASAEQLLRSRYCAYVQGHEQYLLRTWHPSTRPPTIVLLNPAAVHWHGLRILWIQGGGALELRSEIKFIARYTLNGKTHTLQEISEFIRNQGHWFYIKGKNNLA